MRLGAGRRVMDVEAAAEFTLNCESMRLHRKTKITANPNNIPNPPVFTHMTSRLVFQLVRVKVCDMAHKAASPRTCSAHMSWCHPVWLEGRLPPRKEPGQESVIDDKRVKQFGTGP
jgi:hypothetical protein